MQNKIKMRHFEAVIALAEEMHYGRAAKRVGLTQSGLSRCIQSAEREAKATLFERDRTRMELTDAGRAYVEHARVAIAYGERAVRSATASRDGADVVLQVGKAPDIDPILVEILYSIHLPLYPHLEISVHSESSSELAHGLLTSDLDLALITDPARNSKLTMSKLIETPLHVVLPRENPLSSKASLKLNDLCNERWIIFQKRLHPLLYDRIMKRAHDEGFEPRRLDHILFPDEAEHMLSAAPGIAFLTMANAMKLRGPRLVARPLDEVTLCLDEWLAARSDDNSKLVSEFVRAFVTKSKTVLQPPQMSLPMGGKSGTSAQCVSS
jgi:DNA-binding transcriptional LysR family regulator